MANRAQRRAAAKKIKRPPWQGKTLEQKQAALWKNGITARDVEKEFKNGFQQGYEQGSHGVIETCYAAFCLALQDELKFDGAQCKKMLLKVDDYICNSLTSLEIRDEVFERLGLTLNFKEAFPEDRIQNDDKTM